MIHIFPQHINILVKKYSRNIWSMEVVINLSVIVMTNHLYKTRAENKEINVHQKKSKVKKIHMKTSRGALWFLDDGKISYLLEMEKKTICDNRTPSVGTLFIKRKSIWVLTLWVHVFNNLNLTVTKQLTEMMPRKLFKLIPINIIILYKYVLIFKGYNTVMYV